MNFQEKHNQDHQPRTSQVNSIVFPNEQDNQPPMSVNDMHTLLKLIKDQKSQSVQEPPPINDQFISQKPPFFPNLHKPVPIHENAQGQSQNIQKMLKVESFLALQSNSTHTDFSKQSIHMKNDKSQGQAQIQAQYAQGQHPMQQQQPQVSNMFNMKEAGLQMPGLDNFQNNFNNLDDLQPDLKKLVCVLKLKDLIQQQSQPIIESQPGIIPNKQTSGQDVLQNSSQNNESIQFVGAYNNHNQSKVSKPFINDLLINNILGGQNSNSDHQKKQFINQNLPKLQSKINMENDKTQIRDLKSTDQNLPQKDTQFLDLIFNELQNQKDQIPVVLSSDTKTGKDILNNENSPYVQFLIQVLVKQNKFNQKTHSDKSEQLKVTPASSAVTDQNQLSQQIQEIDKPMNSISSSPIEKLEQDLKEQEAVKDEKDKIVCPHKNRRIYCKNMCHQCYTHKGKGKLAYSCEHKQKPHYSNGQCQSCYLSSYYIKRKAKQQVMRSRQQEETEFEPEAELNKRQRTESLAIEENTPQL